MTEQPIRILIVDDDPSMRRVLKMLLADTNDIAVVAEAEDGIQAISMIELLNLDIALVSCTTGELDTIDAVKSLRARGGNIGIVVLDAYDEACGDALAAGADGFVLKESDPDTLVEAIRRVASLRRGPPAA